MCACVRACVRMCVRECSRNHPECPERITCIWSVLESKGYVERCIRIQVRRALVAGGRVVRGGGGCPCGGCMYVCLYIAV